MCLCRNKTANNNNIDENYLHWSCCVISTQAFLIHLAFIFVWRHTSYTASDSVLHSEQSDIKSLLNCGHFNLYTT